MKHYEPDTNDIPFRLQLNKSLLGLEQIFIKYPPSCLGGLNFIRSIEKNAEILVEKGLLQMESTNNQSRKKYKYHLSVANLTISFQDGNGVKRLTKYFDSTFEVLLCYNM